MSGNNLSFALRQLRKSPALTITVVLTLALCIGANSAIYSIVDALFFRSLPFPDAGRLVSVAKVYDKGGTTNIETAQDGEAWQAVRDHASKVKAAVYGGTSGLNLYYGGSVRYVQAQRVSAGFFHVLGVMPVIGREFSPQEDVTNGPPLIILSDRLWRDVFHANHRVLGESVDLRGAPATVIGVMPPAFRTDTPADIWVPLHPSTAGEGGGNNYTIIGRLQPGVSAAAVSAQLESVLAESIRGRFKTMTTRMRFRSRLSIQLS